MRRNAGGGDAPGGTNEQSLQPWQFFVLAALACATAVTFLVRAQGFTPVILLTVLMGAAALVGMAALRTIRPLVMSEEDRTPMIGERTRAALEREKMLALRAIKDLEFDRAMGKIAEDDFHDMTSRLRARAARLIRQLDAGGGYRTQIEQELSKRLGGGSETSSSKSAVAAAVHQPETSEARSADPPAASTMRTCASCSTTNDADARFCKECGAKL
jgi:hypothetical protein